MRALICRQWGGIEQLQIGEAPMPRPGRGEVLIRVKATAVNYADAIMVAGRYQTKPELPFSPGLETAGVIEACGPDVQGLQPGDRVMAILAYGGLAEYAVAPAAVNYASEKLTERVMALTGDKGADVCFDPVGGGLFDAALSALGWGGRILLVGFVGGVPQIPANRLLVKHRAALGSSLRYFRWHAPEKLAHSVAELLRWHGEGKLRPCITHRLPLERAVEGMRLLIDRQAHGKIVVELEPA